MPRCTVVRRLHFNAAHRLHNPARSDAWNAETFGPCNNPNFHGHNYELEVMVEGVVDAETGYVVDVGVLKRIVEDVAGRGVDLALDHHLEFVVVAVIVGVIAGPEGLRVPGIRPGGTRPMGSASHRAYRRFDPNQYANSTDPQPSNNAGDPSISFHLNGNCH